MSGIYSVWTNILLFKQHIYHSLYPPIMANQSCISPYSESAVLGLISSCFNQFYWPSSRLVFRVGRDKQLIVRHLGMPRQTAPRKVTIGWTVGSYDITGNLGPSVLPEVEIIHPQTNNYSIMIHHSCRSMQPPTVPSVLHHPPPSTSTLC